MIDDDFIAKARATAMVDNFVSAHLEIARGCKQARDLGLELSADLRRDILELRQMLRDAGLTAFDADLEL